MKTAIYYFTGTGNSLAIARDLTGELREAQAAVELIPVVKLLQQESIAVTADTVGIVYPAWLHHIPPAIEEFARKATLNCTYLFAVCSYSTDPYNSVYNLNALLEKAGRRLDAGFSVAMGGKYAILRDLVFPPETNALRYQDEQQRVKAIARIVNAREPVGIQGQYAEQDEAVGKQLIDLHRHVHKSAEQFWLTEDCDLCGLCVKLCPRNNLTIVGGQISWGKHCDLCLACLHWCPASAIQNGELSQNSRRHHHPAITSADIIAQKSEA